MKTILLLLAMLSSANAATVRLLWDRNPEPDVVEYRVYVGTSSRTYDRIVSAGNETSISVDQLSRGVTYHFAVTAVNSAGLESDYSNEVSYTTPDKPSAPKNPRVQLESAAIDWRGVTNRTGTAVQPILIVPGDTGVSVRATVVTPSGQVARTVTIGASGKAEFPGRYTSRPFTAAADISVVSVDPDVQSTADFR